jgi:hypothetical protein
MRLGAKFGIKPHEPMQMIVHHRDRKRGRNGNEDAPSLQDGDGNKDASSLQDGKGRRLERQALEPPDRAGKGWKALEPPYRFPANTARRAVDPETSGFLRQIR